MEVSVNRRNPMLGVVRSKPAERPVLAQTLKTPSYEELQREVADLRAEVRELRSEESPIRLDPQNDGLTVKNLKTEDFQVHRLRVKMDAMSDIFEDLTSLEALLKAGMGGRPPGLDPGMIQKEPMQIQDMKISMPGRTLLKSTETVGAESLTRNGIKELDVEPMKGDTLRIKGKMDKLIDVPFDIQGSLKAVEGNKIEFALGKSKVFGVIPIFGLVKRIAAGIAGKSMEDLGVERRGTTFIMDADDFLPENVKVNLTRVGTEDGRLVLEGTAPDKKVEEPPQHAPSTLTVF